jgi:phage terminase large subunit GpA-like protein
MKRSQSCVSTDLGWMSRLADRWTLPPILTVSQWADLHRRLPAESAAEPGQWRTDRAPFQRGIMDAVSDPLVREVWVMKSAQVGWTELLLNVIGFHVDQDPAPMLLVQPTLDIGESFSKDRLAPTVRDTPVLRDKIKDAKSRDSGNTLLHKTFPGGHITIGGANSPAGLASRPIRVALFDEIDRFPPSAGTEGDPISLGRKRTTTFRNRVVMAGSTPTIKGASRIESGFESGDQRFYYVPCPHCDTFQRLVWAQVRWDEGRPDTAAYACQHCGAVLTDADKGEMLRQGEWRASKPTTGIASFHISELYSPWVTWPEMARSFLEAKRLPETLQTWINTALGECWEDKGETLEGGALAGRVEAYTPDHVPAGVKLVTIGTDVQDDRLEATVWGWGDGEEAWRLGHHVMRGDPGQASLWAEHDDLLKRRYTTDDGRTLVMEACCIDSGGHYTEQVYRYAAARKRFRVWAIKGASGQGRLIWPKRAGRGRSVSVDLWLIGVDTAKDLLFGRLKRSIEPGPGYIHFDAATEPEYLEQLTNETVVTRVAMGRRVRMWKPRTAGARVEALDCFVYAYAALQGRGGAELLIRRHAPQAVNIEPPQQVDPIQERIAQSRRPMPRRGGWVGRWK